MANFSERLQQVILEKGFSKAGFAKQVGITPTTVSLWCSIKNAPSQKNIIKAAEVLGVNPEWLETGRGEKYPGGTLELRETAAKYGAKLTREEADFARAVDVPEPQAQLLAMLVDLWAQLPPEDMAELIRYAAELTLKEKK